MKIKRNMEQTKKYGSLAIYEVMEEAELNSSLFQPQSDSCDGSVSSMLVKQNEINSIHKSGEFDSIVNDSMSQKYSFFLKTDEIDDAVRMEYYHGEISVLNAHQPHEELLNQIAESLHAELINDKGLSLTPKKSKKSLLSLFGF